MTLAEKIKYLVNKSKETKVELAKKLELASSSSISQWEKGKTQPSRENIIKLAGYFDKPVDYFEDDPNEKSGGNMVYDAKTQVLYKNPGNENIKHIGILGGVYSEVFAAPSQNCPVEGFLPVLIESALNCTPYALRIESHGVYNGMSKGDIVIIVPTRELANGKTALIKMQNSNSFKKILWQDNGVLLKNGKKQIELKEDQFEIMGHVIGVFKNI